MRVYKRHRQFEFTSLHHPVRQFRYLPENHWKVRVCAGFAQPLIVQPAARSAAPARRIRKVCFSDCGPEPDCFRRSSRTFKIALGRAQARISLASPPHGFQPAHHAAERQVVAIEPTGASVCIRAAKLVEKEESQLSAITGQRGTEEAKSASGGSSGATARIRC
jgi:hypothetical protein